MTTPETNHTTENENTMTEEQQLPSAELLLEIVQKEYENESNRSRILDARIGIFLPLAGLVLAYIASFLNFKSLVNDKIDSTSEIISILIYSLLTGITFLALIVSIVCFVWVISIKKFSRIKIDLIIKEEYLSYAKELTAAGLITNYVTNINNNRKVTHKKMLLYQTGVYCISLAIILSVVLFIWSVNIK